MESPQENLQYKIYSIGDRTWGESQKDYSCYVIFSDIIFIGDIKFLQPLFKFDYLLF